MAAYYTYNFLPPISSDIDSLLHDFEQGSNYDYQSFASIWKQHKLELLFKAADIQPNSFRFFLDDSMTVAAAYLGGSWRLPIQIGALYTLFTIYMYQIEEPKIKVRLTIDTWTSLLDQMESPANIPSDAKLILTKLINEHAFVTSATRHEMGPRFFTKLNYMKSGKYMRSDVLLSSRLNIDEKLVKLCEDTHNLYTKAKDNLTEAYGGSDHVPDEISSIRPNFIEQLKKGLELDISDEEPEPAAAVNQPSQSSIGLTRRRIRAKAEMSIISGQSRLINDESVPIDEKHDDEDEFNDMTYPDEQYEQTEMNDVDVDDDDDVEQTETRTKSRKKKPTTKPKVTRRRSKKK